MPFPHAPILAADEVHVVMVDIGVPAAPSALAALDDDEHRCAAGFHFDRDRSRYVVAHAACRAVVAAVLGVAPRLVRWGRGPSGKPSVQNDRALAMSLTHSGDRALIAVSRGREVGVDIERIRAIEVMDIASGQFSAAEVDALRVRNMDRLEAFYRIWVAKEALLKARGDGLGGPLAAFDVSPEADVPEALVATRLGDARPWSIRPIEVEPPYVAAVAADGPPWRVVHWTGAPS